MVAETIGRTYSNRMGHSGGPGGGQVETGEEMEVERDEWSGEILKKAD